MFEKKSKIFNLINNAMLSDEKRYRLQYFFTYFILATVSAVMTIVNIITKQGFLIYATLVFSLLSYLNVLLMRLSKPTYVISQWLFAIEAIVLFGYLIISGNPQGFSAIWVLMLPSLGLLLFGKERGTILCTVMFIVIIFLFWVPVGRNLLQYEYQEQYMLRFPFAYVAFYFVGFLFETVRYKTFRNYRYFYLHDSLTGALNRKGLSEFIDEEEDILNNDYTTFVMFDIDDFKKINDTYGHYFGDEVLKQLVQKVEDEISVPVCRWGGEEFTIYFPKGNFDYDNAKDLVQKISETPFVINKKEINITISLGIVMASNDFDYNRNDMWKTVDDCLYVAKQNGKNQAIFQKY